MSNTINIWDVIWALPKGQSVQVKIEHIAAQIRRDLFTGLDLMGILRQTDVDKWIRKVQRNHNIRIIHNTGDGALIFYRLDDA